MNIGAALAYSLAAAAFAYEAYENRKVGWVIEDSAVQLN